MQTEIIKPDKFTVDWLQKSLSSQIDTMNKLLGGGANVAKELAFAAQIINGNKYLKICSAQSILKAVFNISGTGLTLNPILSQAYLVPRKNGQRVEDGKKVDNWECYLQPGYQGFIKLLTDGGAVRAIRVHPVYENDTFDFELGTKPFIVYRPTLKRDKGNLIAAFAIATIDGGIEQPYVMTAFDIYDIREKSSSYQSFLKYGGQCIWVDNEGEMSCKTVVRRLQKYLPKSKHEDRISKVLELDNEDFKPTHSQVSYLESLINTSTYDSEHREILLDKIGTDLSLMEFNNILRDVQANQLNAVTQGGNYNQTQLGQHLDAISADNRGQKKLV